MANWYYKLGDQAIGPMDAKQLKQLAASKRLQPDDLVRMGEDSEWVPATRVKGLFPAPAAPSPAVAPAAHSSSSGVFDVDFSQKSHAKKIELNIPTASAVPVNRTPEAIPVSSKPLEGANFDFAVQSKPSVSKAPLPGYKSPLGNAGNVKNTSAGKPGADPRELSPAELKALKKKRQQQMTMILGGVCGAGIVILLTVLFLFSGGKKTSSTNESGNELTAGAAAPGATVPAVNAANTLSNVAAEPGTPTAAEAQAGNLATAGAAAEGQNPSATAFLDASKEAAKFDNLEVKVRSVKRAVPEWESVASGRNIQSKDSDGICLIIELTVVNNNPRHMGKFTPWSGVIAKSGKMTCSLMDSNSNEYSCKNKPNFVFKGVDWQSQELIAGDAPAEDVLVFGRPVPQFEYLELKLNDPTGEKLEPIAFRIPQSMVGAASASPAGEVSKTEKPASDDGLTQETGSAQDLVPEERGIPLGDDEPTSAEGASNIPEPTQEPETIAKKEPGAPNSADAGASEEEKAFADDLGGLLNDDSADQSGLKLDPAMKAQADQIEKENDAKRNADNMEAVKKRQKEMKKK